MTRRRRLCLALETPSFDALAAEIGSYLEPEIPEGVLGKIQALPRLARLTALTTGHDDALVREAAVAALGALGDPAGLPAVLAAAGDKATVRRRAVLALAPFDGPEVDAALARATEDRDWQVRQAAEDLLR